MDRQAIPSDVRRRLRAESRQLDERAEVYEGDLSEDTVIDWFEDVWGQYKPESREVVLSVLLKDLITGGKESGRFALTIESWTERLANSQNGYGKIILEAFFAEALEGYQLACQEFGALAIGDYFPTIPEGRAFAENSARYLRGFLEIYRTTHQREGSGDLLSACWADMAPVFRKSPYVEEFCHFFELPPPGQSLERHTLEYPVGIGGMGVVYLAMHSDEYRVALKLLRPDCSERERFFLEGRSTVQLRDRRFVMVKETHFKGAGTPFFTMDYVEGGTSLSDLLDRPEDHKHLIERLCERLNVENPNLRKSASITTLPIRFWEGLIRKAEAAVAGVEKDKKLINVLLVRVLSISKQISLLLTGNVRKGGLDSDSGDRLIAAIVSEIASATEYLHRAEPADQESTGFVHGDIKPGNILLSKRNGPLLTDLGLSRKLGPDGRAGKESFVGTASYASPEQARAECLTARSDVYQLGGVLYRALTGRAPFRAKPGAFLQETLEQVCTERIITPRELGCAAHPSLQSICLKALNRQPERRYPTAQALAADLDRFVDHKPVQAAGGFVWRSLFHHAVHSIWLWTFLLLAIFFGYQSWMNHSDIPGIEASKNKYRISSLMVNPMKPELLLDVKWPNPTYTHVRIEKSSVMMDLTRWQAVMGEAYKAGRIEPAFYTRVITLQKIPEDGVRKEPFEVTFQFRTEGSDVDLRCSTHPYKVRGSEGRVRFGDKDVRVREIVIDLTKEKFNVDVTIVIQGVIWNGFQINEQGHQWAALLSPTHMTVGELAVLFPPGGKPSTPPRAYVFDHANPKLGNQPLALDGRNFENPSGATWWAWREQFTKADSVYVLEFDWKHAEPERSKTTLSKDE